MISGIGRVIDVFELRHIRAASGTYDAGQPVRIIVALVYSHPQRRVVRDPNYPPTSHRYFLILSTLANTEAILLLRSSGILSESKSMC